MKHLAGLLFLFLFLSPRVSGQHMQVANPIIIPDPAPGYQRIWLKNGDVPRDPKALEDGGDFVNSDVKYPLEELGFSATERVKVFYKEGMRVTATGEAVTRVVLEY